MASSLHQVQLTYDFQQDRLMLSLNTKDFFEYRFWITRRVIKGFWSLLKQLKGSFVHAQAKQAVDDRAIADKIQEEVKNVEAAKYSTRVTRSPMGDEPQLLCKLEATPTEEGRVHFHLVGHSGQFIDFTGDPVLVTILIELITKVLPKTDWDLNLEAL